MATTNTDSSALTQEEILSLPEVLRNNVVALEQMQKNKTATQMKSAHPLGALEVWETLAPGEEVTTENGMTYYLDADGKVQMRVEQDFNRPLEMVNIPGIGFVAIYDGINDDIEEYPIQELVFQKVGAGNLRFGADGGWAIDWHYAWVLYSRTMYRWKPGRGKTLVDVINSRNTIISGVKRKVAFQMRSDLKANSKYEARTLAAQGGYGVNFGHTWQWS